MAEEAAKQLAQVQKRNALMDYINMIPPFSGENGSASFSEFQEKLSNLAEYFQWEEEDKKFALLNRLSGSALKWIRIHKQKSFEEILEILKTRYTKVDSPEVALTKFTHFKQPPSMSVQEFYDQATELSMKALVIEGVDKNIAEKSRNAILTSMLLGNLAPEIRKGVITRDPKSPEEILKFALLEEKAIKSLNPFYSIISNPPQQTLEQPPQLACAATYTPTVKDSQMTREIDLLKQQMELLTTKIDSLVKTQTEKNPPNQPITYENNFNCFYCHQPGHVVRECPLKAMHYWDNYDSYQGGRDYNQRNQGGSYQNFNTYNRRGNGNYNQQRGGRNNQQRGRGRANPSRNNNSTATVGDVDRNVQNPNSDVQNLN